MGLPVTSRFGGTPWERFLECSFKGILSALPRGLATVEVTHEAETA